MTNIQTHTAPNGWTAIEAYSNLVSASKFIEAHGHTAILTADGLLTSTWVIVSNPWAFEAAYEDDDRAFEEPMVFPVVNGMVDLQAIKAWLGY